MSVKLAIEGSPKAVKNKMAGWPRFDEKAIDAAVEVLRSGRVNYWTGPRAYAKQELQPHRAVMERIFRGGKRSIKPFTC